MCRFTVITKKSLGLIIILFCIVFIISRLIYQNTGPNIILISVDTVRADHLNEYGYDRTTSPIITAMALKGVLFKRAISQAPWTLPSVASLHTSLYPSEHNVVSSRTKLADDIETLAETLNRYGYYTIGLVSCRFASKKHGLAQGFEVFDESQIISDDTVTSGALTNMAAEYIKNGKQKPFFLWIHYFDPHATYVRHPEFGFASGYTGQLLEKITTKDLRQALKQGQLTDEDIEFVKAVYDEEIAYTYAWIGKLLDQLNSMGVKDSTVTILTADHGEYFMERGRFFHCKDVYNELVHVPLIISGAIDEKLHGCVVNQSVEISSVPKTIMALVGVDEYVFGGKNLLALADKESDSGFIFTEGSYPWGDDDRKKAVIFKGWKLIYNFDDGTYELYHIDKDWNERKNLWNDSSTEITTLKMHLRETLDRFPHKKTTAAPKLKLDEETINHLRSLGYIK